MPAASMTSGETQTSEARDPVTSRPASSRLAIVAWPGRLTVLKAPPRPRSAAESIQAARSRQSMYCSGRSGGPGASTSPPCSRRRSHHGIRPTIS